MIGMGLNSSLLFDVSISYFNHEYLAVLAFCAKNKKKILEKH